MKMLLAGEWVDRDEKIEVRNPYDNSLIDTVPKATREDVEKAVSAAKKGQKDMAALSAYERYEILMKAAEIMERRKEELATVVSKEVGKTIREARGEIARALQTLTLSAEEAKRLTGEEVRFDGAPTGKGKAGLYIRVPVGIVAAITPFNFPVNLAMHKIAPGLAAGNAVILKPPSITPLSSIIMGEIFMEAGVPPLAFQVITGSGSTVGEALASHPDIRKISFTGSREVGKRIMSIAGFKKCTMELGSNSAVIVCDDAELDKAFPRVVLGAYALAGQVCISVQRIFVHKSLFDEFVERYVEHVKKLKVGDQLKEDTDVGPLVEEKEARRVKEWIEEAVSMGARLLIGGEVEGALMKPAVLTHCPKKAKLFWNEAFGPVVIINPVESLEEAIAETNDSMYGLQAGIYTKNLYNAWKAAYEVEVGGVIINDVPTFRVDLMPYGGVKDSGIGREGPKYAIQDMTEIKLICFDLT
ncbi:MAG: aldehyde dehydrogenase family protein [Deferribacteres bacterium]|nr:aldehyde dehydrogenase family protein [Deferribacteres bacterium]